MKTYILIKSVVLTWVLTFAYNLNVQAQDLDPSTDPHIDSHIRPFLKAVNRSAGASLEKITAAAARAGQARSQASVKVDLSGINVSEKTINAGGQDITINIVKPADSKGKLPVFMFFHGGGWVLGDLPTHERLVRDLVVESGAAAVFVNYSRSPEVHFPVAINQAYAATAWVAEHGDQIGVDGKKMAVAGNSAGGNITAVVALMAKDNHGPEIKLQILMWPVTDSNFDDESYKKFGTGRFLTKKAMIWFWDSYTTNQDDRDNIYASPLRATTEQLRGLPPALVQTAENDVLRDEGEAYARKLDEAGVPTTCTRYDGMIHDWGAINQLAEIPATRSMIHQAAGQLKEALK
ncbi:alpha/beta hydrolase [Mucilaginibacter kameinonensis]|uniref:alpha/beta hydrolase n=1 Tax=Mucilaginibacter kameinonensis TaxID=452286 RepID=UPI000EF81034|nr:alpha/beta hydrolase [Mucilaginibacter kameinonensis]